MRKLFVVIVCLGTVFSSWSQYQSLFGSEHTQWRIIEPNEFFQMNVVTWQFDTLVEWSGDTLYKVDRVSPDLPQSIYIREDLQSGKAWACNSSNDCYLFFDLSLNVGDTLANDDQFNCPQSQADSVYWDYLGRKHIRFVQDHGVFDHFEMIEGVGTSAGLYKFVWGMLGDPSLICQQKDDTLHYEANNPFVENCEYTLDVQENMFQSISIYPNPVADEFSLQLQDISKLNSLVILDQQGRVLKQWSPEELVFKVSELKSGTYFLKVETRHKIQLIPFLKL